MAGPLGPPIPLADSSKSPEDKASELSIDTGEVGETEAPPTSEIITVIPPDFSGYWYSYADSRIYHVIPHQPPTRLSEDHPFVQRFRGLVGQGQPRPRSVTHENITPWRAQHHSNQVYSANTSIRPSRPPSHHQPFESYGLLQTAKAAHVQTGPIRNDLAIVKTPLQPRLFLARSTLPQPIQDAFSIPNSARHPLATEKAITHTAPAEVGLIRGYFDFDPSGSQEAQALAGVARMQTYIQRYHPGGETLSIQTFAIAVEMHWTRQQPFDLSMDLSTIVARRNQTGKGEQSSDLQGLGHQFENHTAAFDPHTTASQLTAVTMYHHGLCEYHSVRRRAQARPPDEGRPLRISEYVAVRPRRINHPLTSRPSDDGHDPVTFASPQEEPEKVHYPPLFASESPAFPDEKTVVDLLRAKSRLPKSVRQLLSVEIIKKILFLALHGIPSAAIAYEVHGELPKTWKLSVTKRMEKITYVIDHYLVEIVAEADRECGAEDFISKLLTHALSKDWIPRSLQNAVEYIHSETAGDVTSGVEERRLAAKARIALQKWRSDNNGANPAPDAKGKRSSTDGSMPLTKRRKSMGYWSACQGLQREMDDRQRLLDLGYREDSLDTEKALMNEWLEKLKKMGRLPSLTEAAQAAHQARTTQQKKTV